MNFCSKVAPAALVSRLVDPSPPNKWFLCQDAFMYTCETYYISITLLPKVPELSPCATQGPYAITPDFMLKVLTEIA